MELLPTAVSAMSTRIDATNGIGATVPFARKIIRWYGIIQRSTATRLLTSVTVLFAERCSVALGVV